jgi:hypothetical protein
MLVLVVSGILKVWGREILLLESVEFKI